MAACRGREGGSFAAVSGPPSFTPWILKTDAAPVASARARRHPLTPGPTIFPGFPRPPAPDWLPPDNPFSSDPAAVLHRRVTPVEKFAGGLRSPNGANIDAAGNMFVADNQGGWLPSSTFAHMKPGKFYGYRQNTPHPANWAEGLPYQPPTAWLPHGSVRSSPAQPVAIPSGTYAGQWLQGDANGPGLLRIALDTVDGDFQGAVFWFTNGTGNAALDANRLTYFKLGALKSAAGESLFDNEAWYTLNKINPSATVVMPRRSPAPAWARAFSFSAERGGWRVDCALPGAYRAEILRADGTRLAGVTGEGTLRFGAIAPGVLVARIVRDGESWTRLIPF